MNVMNRKMFANRDARRKLANMGGIVASSPELLGTAQRFENGGGAFPRQEYADMLPGFQDMIFDRRRYDQIARSIPGIFGKYDPDNPRERRDAVREFAVSRLGEDAAREIFSRLPGVTSKDKEFRDDSTTLPLKGPGYALPLFGEEYRGGVPLRYENLANSVETRKGLASIYQPAKYNRETAPSVSTTQNDLTEFEKIRQGMDAVPEAGQSVEPAVVKVKTVRIGDPLGGTDYELYSDGSAILVSSGTKIDPNNASNQTFLQMLQDLPDVSDTSDMSQPPVIKEPVLESAPITEDERGVLSRIGSVITDFVKADLAQGFPKLPDSREAKEELIRGEGIFSSQPVVQPEVQMDDGPALTYDQIVSKANSGEPITTSDLVKSVEAGLLNDTQSADVNSMIDGDYIPDEQEQSIANLEGGSEFVNKPANPDMLPSKVYDLASDYFAGIVKVEPIKNNKR